MFEHFSLRGIRAAVSALKKALAAEGKELPLIGTPAMLQGKRRNGMSAKSAWARFRSKQALYADFILGFPNRRLKRATGPGSYAEASPQQLLNAKRRERIVAALVRLNHEVAKIPYNVSP